MEQHHTAKVMYVQRKGVYKCDGLVTENRGVALQVKVADCFPVFLFSEDTKVKGVLHAGWRGVSKGIIENARKIFSSLTSAKIISVIGPGICPKCYEVGEEFFTHFKKYKNFLKRKDKRVFLNLFGVIKEKLKENGIFYTISGMYAPLKMKIFTLIGGEIEKKEILESSKRH